jgi:hypothetical protein
MKQGGPALDGRHAAGSEGQSALDQLFKVEAA